MGFDIECIIDIHSYPGEYFCPVCRTLVYPKEAFQSQCTHLYCKPCLVHIANGSKACPYDGYLVTESDSKPLMDSDKALAENIGKVKVHCLYFRSGCTWEGTLSDCTSHCSGCSFGNSPVICNRCGIQIVHRQVPDHAQSCPGVYEGQPAVGGVSSVPKSGTITSSAEVNQAASQSGASLSQAQNPPQNVTATPVPGQNPNLLVNASSQAPVVTPAAVPTPEQWYQQQYQQYYQQYAGYDPYQQANLQYYQQHSVQVHGQQQSHVYSQSQHANPVPQAPQQPHFPQAQGQAQSQPQPQMVPQSQAQVQGPPQGQGQLHAPTQALVPNYQVNSQQQGHPPMRPQTQIPPQTLPPPPPQSQPLPYAQAMGMRPPAQHPQYQQSHVQMHHPQPTQAHVQPQMQPQAQAQAQSSNQLNVQMQPHPQPYHSQTQPPVFPQVNQPPAPPALPQAPYQPAPPVSGHHSYQHSQPPQKMHSGAPQQHPVHPQIASGPSHPVQVHGQVPQQNAMMRPPSHGSVPQQHPPALLAPQNQGPGVPPAQNNQFPPQPAYPIQHRPAVQLAQQPMPPYYAQQQQFLAPFQSQLHQQEHLTQQHSNQMQMRPSGPPQAPQSQNFVWRPIISNQGMHSQSNPISSGGFGALGHPGPSQLASSQTFVNQNYANSTVPQQDATVQENRSPSKGLLEKGGDPLNEEVVAGQNGTAVKDPDTDASGIKSFIKQEENGVQGAMEKASGGKSFEDGTAGNEFQNEEGKLLADSDAVVSGPSSTNFDKPSITAVSSSGVEGHVLPPHSHGSHQQRPQAQVQGQPPSILGPQGPGISPHPAQSLNSIEGRNSGYFGPPPTGFESQSGPLADPRGIMGRAPPLHFEGQYGAQHVGRAGEIALSRDQMSSSTHTHLSGFGEGGPPSKTHADEPSSLRMNGLTASRSLDKAAPHGQIYDAASKMDPAASGPHSRFLPHHPSGVHGQVDVFGPGPEFVQPHMKPFPRRSSDGDYIGSSPRGFGGPSSFPRGTSASDDIKSREAHRFGEGSRSFNLSSDPAGNPFHDRKFPPMSSHMRRGELDGPGNPRFGDQVAPGLHHNQTGSDGVFGPDGPGHLMRGKFSGPSGHFNMAETAGPASFRGRGHAGEFGGPGNYPHYPFNESVRGDTSGFPHFGDPPMRNNYSLHGFPSAGNFPGGMDAFDQSRKRKSVSSGWCRICEIDCETVEGLDLHSQTREHQKMAMDIVKSIKLQNKKKQRTFAVRMMNEGGSRSRKMGNVGRGSQS